jgi:hypothetical protein
MATNVVNQVAYLPTSRHFPTDIKQFTIEVNKSYVEIAQSVNSKTIGIFPTMRPAINGEEWFLTDNFKRQGLRQVYTFTTTAALNHNVNVEDPSQFVRCFGSFTDGTNAYGLLFASNVAIVGQISFYLTTTQIIFLTGAGAPVLTSGTIILEWLSQP